MQSHKRGPLDTGFGRTSWTRVSEKERLCCGSLVKVKIDVWEMFSDNSYLRAIFDRHGLQVAAPIDPRTKKAESSLP